MCILRATRRNWSAYESPAINICAWVWVLVWVSEHGRKRCVGPFHMWCHKAHEQRLGKPQHTSTDELTHAMHATPRCPNRTFRSSSTLSQSGYVREADWQQRKVGRTMGGYHPKAEGRKIGRSYSWVSSVAHPVPVCIARVHSDLPMTSPSHGVAKANRNPVWHWKSISESRNWLTIFTGWNRLVDYPVWVA